MKKRILFTAAALVCAANLTAQCLGVGSSTSSMSPEAVSYTHLTLPTSNHV